MTRKLLTVYHDGIHRCTPKLPVAQNDTYIENALKEVGGNVGPKQLAFMKMTKEMARQQANGKVDMDAIVSLASQLSDSQRVSDLKRHIKTDLKCEKHSLSSVGELKSCTDTKDKYYIYKINDMNMNGQPSYVFKSSRRIWETWPYPWGKNTAKILCKMNCVILMECIGDVMAGKL